MTILVKYCGGCNPRFDRTGLVQRLQKQFPSLEIWYNREEGQPDLVIELNGCERGCVSATQQPGRIGTLQLVSEEDYDAIAQAISQALQS